MRTVMLIIGISLTDIAYAIRAEEISQTVGAFFGWAFMICLALDIVEYFSKLGKSK